MKRALVLFSAGMDSVAITLKALEKNDSVILLYCKYNAKNQDSELRTAPRILRALRNKFPTKEIKFRILDLTESFKGVKKGIANPEVSILGDKKDFLTDFRNGIFLAYGYLYAGEWDYDSIYIGTHILRDKKVTFGDCLPEFIEAFETAGKLGIEKKVDIIAPLQDAEKAYSLEILKDHNFPLDLSWTCYASEVEQCGICVACYDRKIAFKEAGIVDTTVYLTEKESSGLK